MPKDNVMEDLAPASWLALKAVHSAADLWRFRPVAVESAAAVANQLASKLWAYRPRERLPSLNELAHQMRVQSNLVQLGLSTLESKGLIQVAGGVPYVRQYTALNGPVLRLAPEARRRLQKDWPLLEAILRRRAEVEATAARLAAINREMGNLQVLGSSVRNMEEASWCLEMFLHQYEQDKNTAKKQGELALWRFRREDWIFHLELAWAAREDGLFEELETLRRQFFEYVDPYWYRWLDQQDSVQEHQHILATLHKRDSDGAAAAAVAHMDATRESLLRRLRA